MMKRPSVLAGAVTLAAVLGTAGGALAQLPGVENGEWHYLGGDAGHTRSSPLTQIHAGNFSDLQVAWVWRADNFGPDTEYTFRSTPSFARGVLYTVVGQRRQVAAIDAATGETLWTFREPETIRYLRSPRTDFGKGVAYAEVDGRGVVYITSPAFFLWALDAETGRPLENWGRPVPLEGFSRTGVVDLLPDLLRDWGVWEDYVAAGGTYDPDYGIPREIGMITSSAPPIVVNGVVVVLNSHEPSYAQTRIENVPGDIMGFDARTGEFLWKFHVIPRPGEFGHDTWENDAWRWTGDMSSWAPAAADPELGLVYIVTNTGTVESYTGHRPGDNLFGGSVLALDVRTGQRRWHYQLIRNEQWNFDIPTAPMLLDVNVGGRRIPALIQYGKTGLVFAFNRETGEPIWPIEERPVIRSIVPGEWTPPTQPFPTLPEPQDPIVDGLTEEFVIDFTPELKRRALEILKGFEIANVYAPRLPVGHDLPILGYVRCTSGVNIPHPPVADPTTGITYSTHSRTCGTTGYMAPTHGVDEDNPNYAGASAEVWRGRDRSTPTTGRTVAAWLASSGAPSLPRLEGLPLWKPPYNMLTAHDMNTGRRLWSIPIGHTPAGIRNNPALAGLPVPETGGTGLGIMMVMGDLLVQTTEDLRGEAELNENGMPVLHARDKRTGEILSSIELPIPGNYGMMTYMHEGRQYIVVQSGSARRDQPGALVALRLP
jgi:glucose dehydrogenase